MTTWARGTFGGGIAQTLTGSLWTADQVAMFEQIQRRMVSQGAGSFSQAHRDQAPAGISDEEYSRMSFGEKMEYARQHGNGTARR